jgi:putative oxidoreductase
MNLYSRAAALAERLLPQDLLLLVARFGIASVFFLSGRTKVDGWLHITDSTYALFESEYSGVPLPSHLAAHLATYSEHLFPLLLVFGLFTRFGAIGLLGMTLTIQTFVYPDAWSTHLSWAAILLPLIAYGGGRLSLDNLLGIDPAKARVPTHLAMA